MEVLAFFGSGEGLCSLTVFPPTDFESVMSADSITPPYSLTFIHPTHYR